MKPSDTQVTLSFPENTEEARGALMDTRYYYVLVERGYKGLGLLPLLVIAKYKRDGGVFETGTASTGNFINHEIFDSESVKGFILILQIDEIEAHNYKRSKEIGAIE